MTPTTLSASLSSLYRAQPATYGAALDHAPGGFWKYHTPQTDRGTDAALAMLMSLDRIEVPLTYCTDCQFDAPPAIHHVYDKGRKVGELERPRCGPCWYVKWFRPGFERKVTEACTLKNA